MDDLTWGTPAILPAAAKKTLTHKKRPLKVFFMERVFSI